MSLLFAICGKKDNPVTKEVPLNAEAQTAVESVFSGQAREFRQNIERPFDENWIPDDDEIMTIGVPQDVTIFTQIMEALETGVAPIDTQRFDSEDILALAVKDGASLLVQRFLVGQSLTKSRLALLFRNGTFTHLTETAFHLDKELLCIIEEGLIKFRSLQRLGRLIKTSKIFRAATDSEVSAFVESNANLFDVSDIPAFVKNTNRNARKYIKSITTQGLLGQSTAQSLRKEARKTNLDIQVRKNKIVMPEGSKDINDLMQFLNDGRFPGPISGQPYITNSRRLVKA